MEKVIDVCSFREEIIKRLALCCPHIPYKIEGEDMLFTIIAEVNRTSDGEILEELFEKEKFGDGELTLPEYLISLLEYFGITIATAESCTGGLLASSIINVAGASSVFYEGLITYSNNAKMDRLGVSVDTLLECGAVSPETAVEMANGLLSDSVAVSVSVTGIAGPSGGSDEKPVGLVYIAVVSDDHTDVFRNIFKGDRTSIRKQAANMALFYAAQHIKNYF